MEMETKKIRKRSRFTLQLEDCEEKLSCIRQKIEKVKNISKKCNNYDWLNEVLDFYIDHNSADIQIDEADNSNNTTGDTESSSCSATQLSRKEVHTALDDDDGEYFITSKASVRSLVKSLSESKGCCSICGVFFIDSCQLTRRGHCGRLVFTCNEGHDLVWFSSPNLQSKFVINLRMIHGFVSSGLTETQYRSFMMAAGLGSLEHTYLDTVLNKLGYYSCVESVFEEDIDATIKEVQVHQSYIENDGDIVITDARHDSSRNAQHTTVTAMSYYTNKILGTLNWSKTTMSAAQSREVPMTKMIVENLERKGHKIVEIAHDNVASLQNWATKEKEMLNSYDTWHGGKNVKKIMEVSKGNKKDEGTSWFHDLSDKAKATKTHCYYTMKAFSTKNGTVDGFRNAILNVIEHYQGNHANCAPDSRCQQPDYVCSKKPLENPKAITAYRNALTSTLIYRNAEAYMRCRDTFWLESFHSTLLIYAPKRINFGDETYNTRIQLAVLDWNENVHRDVFCVKSYQYARNPDRVAPTRVLKPKTFTFRDKIWSAFFSLCL